MSASRVQLTTSVRNACKSLQKEEHHGNGNVVQWRAVRLFAWKLGYGMGLAAETRFLNESSVRVVHISWKRNIVMAAALMDDMLYAGIAIVVFVGTVMMVTGMVAEK